MTTSLIPLTDFFKNPAQTQFKISPNGQFISYLAPYQNRLNVFVQTIDGKQTTQITSDIHRDIPTYVWATNDTLLYVQDDGGDENHHLFAANIDGESVRDLTPFPEVKVQLIDDLRDQEEEVLIAMNKKNPQLFDVYRLHIKTGDLQLEAENPGNISAWYTDHNGQIRIAIATDGVTQHFLYRATGDGPFERVLTTNFKDSLSPLFFTFDNQYIYALSNLGRDKLAAVIYDIANGQEVEELLSHDEVDINGFGYSRKRKVLTTAYYITDKVHRHFFDPERKQIYEKISSLLQTKSDIYLLDKTKAEDAFLVRTLSDRSLGTYYLFDTKTDQLTKLADVSPWLNAEELAEMQPISYTSRDGLTIHGYLTLPKQAKQTNLPVVINPHGGPWHRDTWGFNPEVQFLANRGYAVLQMNFRGSTGYGRDFWQASFKQWGLKMQDDITDGVHWLIEQGIADPKRIAIYGGSYGGYATLAGITFTPDLYACAIDYVGVSNLFTFLETIPPYWKPYLEMMYEMVGHPEEDKERLTATTPVFHVDKIKAPLFIAQGAKDPRVKQSESDQMVEALQKRGVTTQYMVRENEGHGFRNQENKFAFYEAIEEFLATHLA